MSKLHASDCAVHNMPAIPNGPCDCGFNDRVYRVSMSYFDGDHGHGLYESPLFSTKELAEQFRNQLIGEKKLGSKGWYSVGAITDDGPENSAIDELVVLEKWNGDLKDRKDYITHT